MLSCDTQTDLKKIQVRTALIKELDKMFSLFREIEDSAELQTVYNIFLFLQNTNVELLASSIHNDLCIKFYDNIIPNVNIDFFLNYDIASHIRSSITTENIYVPVVIFCKKMQSKMQTLHNNHTDKQNKILITIAGNLQKVIKLSFLYNK
tara:strand:- start:189 stop:638 length:450 start_codon:yes stop_codon:yes gene_type:complete